MPVIHNTWPSLPSLLSRPPPSLSHFINLCSYNGLPQSLALAQTACKLLSALVAVTSAVMLFRNLPDLATVHRREVDLRTKVCGNKGRGGGDRGRKSES